MAKQLNVDLRFNADTSQARQQIQQLQQSLTQIAAAGSVGIGGEKITADMKKASAAAKELQMHLSKAMNPQTGTLDLNRFNNSLLGAKTNVQALSTSLLQIGPSGTTAFTQLATSIAAASRPTVVLNGKLMQLWTVMKNTMRWQLTSSMLHGFIGGISNAYRYAQDLNKSLNNIRIVTGYSAEHMEEFAVQANKAAKALSTTTNEYAKASLIYYQQGLSAEEVNKRAEVTIKLANVSRQSAETVSDQMTAVWNNFYDGSKSLEYYADVMTALGAKTASSTAEIAGGLEKFAAIGDTIGLSYEYAAAALATITANTRQSEDVVGTALKTIFARIQGLKLGETLEDGTELNKYSEALKSVGIDIFDANKELKNMDTILDETAAKWETLTKAQQTALAQTVAGVRQYNQFIALMDNWNDGTSDSMVKNLETSYGATGALQNQADIYAESWEAARNRVKASAEAIYDALLDDKFFIGINNMFSGLLDSINGFISGIGGLKGVLLGAFALISSALVSKIQPAINNTIANFQVLFQGAAKSAIKLGNQMSTVIQQAQQNTNINLSLSQNQELTNANQLIELKNKLSIANKNLSENERILAENSVKVIQAEQEKAVALAKTIEKLEEQKIAMQQNMVSESNTDKIFEKMIAPNAKTYNQLEAQKNTALLSGDSEKIAQINNQLTLLNQNNEQIEFSANAAAKALAQAFVSMQNGKINLVEGNQLFGEYIANLTDFANKNLSDNMTPRGINDALIVIKQYINTLPEAITGTKEFKQIMTQLENSNSGTGLIEGLNQIKQKLLDVVGDTKLVEKMLRQLGQGSNVEGFKKTIDDLNNKEKELLNTTNQINNAIKNFNPTHKFTGVEKITAMGSSMTSLAMSVNMFKSAISAIGNEDMSWGEKLTTIMMSLGMSIPMVTTLFNNMYKMMGIGNAAEIANMQKLNLAILETQGLNSVSIFQEGQKLVAKMSVAGATCEEIEAELEKQGIQLNGISLTQFEEATDLKALTTKGLVISSTQAQTAVDKLQQAATNGNILAKAQLWALEKAGLVTMVTENGVKKAKIVLDKTETTSQFALGVARAFANHPLLIALGLLAALIGVVALVVVGIKALVDAYNADAIALEQANAALVEQQKVLQETKAAHEELIATLGKYEEAYNSLQTMTKGTEEWKNQVEELNKQVVDLITKYPKLAQYVQRDANGVLSLNSEGIEEFKKESDQKIQDAEIRTLQAQRRVNSAKQQNDITQMSRNAKGLDMTASIVNGAGLGALAGAKYGLATDTATLGGTMGLGTLLGTLGGAIIGGVGGAVTSFQSNQAADEQAKEQINNLISGYTIQGEDFLSLKTTQSALDELAKALGQDTEAIIELIRSNQALNETNRLLIEQEVDQQFKDDKVYQNSKYQDVMRDRAADIKETEGKVTDADIKAAEKSLGFSGGFLTTDNYDEYLKALYGDDAKNYKIENGGGTHFTVKKFNEEKQQYETVGDKNGVSNKEAVNIVAQKIANERADKKVKEKVDTFEIEKQAQQLEAKYKEFGISDESATQLTSSILKGEKVNFAEINQSDLDKLYNYRGRDRQMNEFKHQVQDFEDNGGVLNATNKSFKEIYNTANQDVNIMRIEDAMKKENEILIAQQQIETIKGFYKELNDEDKKLFAETIDFKLATNKEMMQTFLDQEKENKAMSEGRAQAEAEGFDPDVLETQAQQIMKNTEGMEDNAEAAVEMALANQRLNKGVDKLTDGWKDWNKALRASDKTTKDYAEALENTKDSLREMFGLTEEDIIPDSFFKDTKNLDLIDQVANGSEEALAQLHFNLTKAQIESQEFTADIAQNMRNAFQLPEDTDYAATFEDMKKNAVSALEGIKTAAQNVKLGKALEIKPEEQAQYAAQLNEYAMAAGWTAEQMQSALSSVGVRAKITYAKGEPITKAIPITKITRSLPEFSKTVGPDGKEVWGFSQTETAEVIDHKMVEEPTVVPQIEMEDPKNPKAQTKPIFSTVSMGNIAPSVTSGGKSGGGGGNKSKTPQAQKPPEHKKKSDELERYYEIDNAIEDQTNLLEKLAIAKDEAWGADKLKAMQDEIKASEKELALGEERLRQIDEWLEKDKTKVESYGITFNEDGRINNLDEVWTQQEEKWYQGQLESQRRERAYEEAKNADENYDADGSIKLANEEYAKQIDDDYNEFMKAVEQYDNTLSEQAKQRLDNLQKELEIKQQNYEELEYKIELKVELNENDIADIEHQLERLGDNNVYASAERIALIQKNATSYRNIADAQMEAIKEAERLYAAGEISQENYMARLQESKEALQDAEMSIREGIQQIGEELSNTFDLVDEKLDQQFAEFDQMIELMDHYKNVVSLTEGEASYKEFNEILKASQQVLRDRIEADKSEVAMWTASREQLEADMEGMDKNSPEYLAAEESLNNIMEKEAEAKSQLMADIEQLGEYAQEIFENAIEQAKIDFEEAMFGGRLSSVIESIDMLNAKQEEVLTTTNKIYETNKLIRNVEKDIEATTNNRAKQAYAEFQNKVKQKQEQNELTKFELDLLNAEYEITKAQIALEEAQNAKDTVRLTRDNEGNYGYIYTANEDKVNDAEQKLEDATNSYYNTALEGAQKYQDQIYQHIEEWEEKVTEVMMDQTLSEEEKNKKIAEINATYDEMIRRDKELYYIAIDGIRDSSYNTQVDYDLKGIASAENWFNECDGFIEDLKTAQWNYDSDTQEIATHTEENFGKMSDAIDGTKKASQKLVEDMTKSGGIIDTCNNELKDSIDNATLAWQKYIEALEEVIRLTDEAMKKNHDTQLKETYKDDYAAEISNRLANDADYDDYDIQQLLQYRWDKMGGVDNTDYQALINAGGTPEQIALWEVLRRFKIDKTDWSTVDGDWAKDIRATKMDQDFAQLIINYFKSSSHARWSDETVQSYLAARQAKIDENHESAKGAISNEELKAYVAQLLNKKPEQLKTGGYTGSWGPEGRLAVLHEKELVLNAEDTKNFLSATGILREISQMLDRDALIASLGAINLRAMTLNSPADQVLQQEVTIHADFPNVTDHNEIEIAIDNLINAASQHAFKS